MSSLFKGKMIDWSAQDVRATFFTSPSATRIDDLYELAYQNRPQSYQEAPPTAPAQASGQGSLGQLILTRGSGRYDLSLQPLAAPSLQAPPGAPAGEIHHALVHDVPGSVLLIKEAARRIVPKLEKINRVAFAVNLSSPAPSYVAANSIINTILPYSIVLNEETDFNLQANYKTYIDKPPIEINSFAIWSVSPVQQINIIAGNTGSDPAAAAQIIESYFLAQKIIDINTPPTAKIYSIDETLVLIDALVSRLDTLMTIS